MDNLFAAAGQFALDGRVVDVLELGSGNINNTFLVTADGKGPKHFVLQRINTRVFRRPELVMSNMRVCSEHVLGRLQMTPFSEDCRWEVPRVLSALSGLDHWIAPDGSFWRAISYISGSQSLDTIKDIDHAREVGRGLGMFHALLSDLAPDSLSDTLEGFHVTPLYLRHYEKVLAGGCVPKSPEVKYCLRFVEDRKDWAHVLEDAKEQGILRLRPIHGDPKVNNIMMDAMTGRAVSIIDLDTVKPGLVHYDIGDCIRSGCNPLGEETDQWEKVVFDAGFCGAILEGYLSKARDCLSVNDIVYIYDSIRLIAFELGVRFLADYLEGNIYFKVRHPEHNLARALVQFRLTESIESQEKAIRGIVRRNM